MSGTCCNDPGCLCNTAKPSVFSLFLASDRVKAPVVRLAAGRSLCTDADQIATRLEEAAADIRRGLHGGVVRVMVLIEAEGPHINQLIYGRPTSLMEGVGMLELAKRRLMFDD